MNQAGKRRVDWAESRSGQPWTMTSPSHLEGRVILAKDSSFTRDGMKVLIALRQPWFSLNLHERWIDARKFYRLRLKVRADLPGALELMAGTPDGEQPWARPLVKVTPEWREVEIDLRRVSWSGDSGRGNSWGGAEGLVNQLRFLLALPVGHNVTAQLKDLSLLGEGAADRSPPLIEALEDAGRQLRFRITHPAGLHDRSLVISVNGLVFDARSRTVTWDGQELSWNGRHVQDERLTVYVEAANREGIRGAIELQRANPRREAGRAALNVGFMPQRRSKEVTLTRGRSLEYDVTVGGQSAPINRSIEFQGRVRDPKVLVEGGVDFETPQSIARSILKAGMSSEEKAYAIWRFEMASASSLGLANPIDRSKYVNVFGYGYCTSHAQTVQALCEAADLPWMFLRYQFPTGHGTTQFFWDRGWHMLDSHQRLYLLTSDGRHVASAEEIEGDPEIMCPGRLDIANYREDQRFPRMYYRPVDINPIHETAIYKSILAGDMSQELRCHERLVRTWQGHGRWAHSPIEPLDYANGWLVFDPRLTAEGLAEEAQEVRNVACLSGNQGLSPRRSGRASVTYRLASAYLFVGGRIGFTARSTSARNTLRIMISTDEGATWQEAGQSSGSGQGPVCVDIGRFMSKRWVEADSPIFLDVYACLIRVDMERTAGILELSDLRTSVDLQLHPVALPGLRLGQNRCTFTCGPHQGPVTITHRWDEMTALRASEATPSAGQKVTLQADVTNREKQVVGPLSVQFFEGHPDIDGQPIGRPVTLRRVAAGKTVTASRLWTAATRMHRPLRKPYKGYIHTDIYAVVRARAGQPLGGSQASLAQLRLTVRDRPRLEMDPAFVNWEPKPVRAGRVVRIVAAVWNGSSRRRPYGDGFVYVNGTALEKVRVRMFSGLPGKGGRLLGQGVIRHIEPLEHGVVRIACRTPVAAGRLNLYVEASCVDVATGKMLKAVVRKPMPLVGP